MQFQHRIHATETSQRLDIFLAQATAFQDLFTTPLTRSAIARLIENEAVLINDKPVKPSYKLKSDDQVTVNLPEDFMTLPAITPNPDLNIPIIFENENFLVIDKPVGVQSHPARAFSCHCERSEATPSSLKHNEIASSQTPRNDNAECCNSKNHNTVANWFIAHYPQGIHIGDDSMRPCIVHRLDKDTSGLMVIAKTQGAFEEFKRLFHEREVEKTYLAVVYGHLKRKEGIIDVPIARAHSLRKQSIATANTKTRGKVRTALTHYQVLQSFKEYDLVEAKPKTGRMHQIRLHLAHIGHPIVGDKLYTPKNLRQPNHEQTNQRNHQTTKSPTHHLLHAHKLEFSLFGIPYSFVSSLPDEFRAYLEEI